MSRLLLLRLGRGRAGFLRLLRWEGGVDSGEASDDSVGHRVVRLQEGALCLAGCLACQHAARGHPRLQRPPDSPVVLLFVHTRISSASAPSPTARCGLGGTGRKSGGREQRPAGLWERGYRHQSPELRKRYRRKLNSPPDTALQTAARRRRNPRPNTTPPTPKETRANLCSEAKTDRSVRPIIASSPARPNCTLRWRSRAWSP